MKKNDKKLIILDRDGVINYDSDDYIKSVDEWQPIPSSLEAIKKINDAGIKVAIASNQSGIARGYYGISTLDAMHQKMRHLLAKKNAHIDALAYCPHLSEMTCVCRKPKPGMLINLLWHFNVEPSNAIFIGDSATDIAAAKSVGMSAAFVQTGKTLPKEAEHTPVFNSLFDAVNYLL